MGCCNAINTEHGRYGQSCMQKLWSAVLSLHVRVYIAIADERGRYLVCSRVSH